MDTTPTLIAIHQEDEAAHPGAARMARLAVHADRALAPSGWRIREVTVNLHTGFARIAFLRWDGDGNKGRLVTIHRPFYGGKVVAIREVGYLRPGMYQSFWDFSSSEVLGRETSEGLRAALRSTANYLQDNPAAGALRTGREPLRLLAGALIECGAA